MSHCPDGSIPLEVCAVSLQVDRTIAASALHEILPKLTVVLRTQSGELCITATELPIELVTRLPPKPDTL